MQKVFVLNSGIVSAIGLSTPENEHALLHQIHGISVPEVLDTKHIFSIGEIKKSNQDLAKLIKERDSNADLPLKGDLPRTALLSILAAQEAFLPFKHKINGLKIGFISANTVGGMDFSEMFMKDHFQDKNNLDKSKIRYHENGSITDLSTRALGLNCWSTTISTACSSSANSIMMAARLIKQNHFDLIIAGGCDALSRFTLNGFNSLMILDKNPCKPFNQNRNGLNLGEAAAYLVLGNEKAEKQLNIKAKCIISGFANANDAFHQTASSPEGIGNQLAMKGALKEAALLPEDIDYINLHGTGTLNNDLSEGLAIQQVFGENPPAASSTKTFTGHTLGAAGAIEAVFSIMSLENQSLIPHLRFEEQMKELKWKPVIEPGNKPLKRVLSNSFGFGGNCSSLIFERI